MPDLKIFLIVMIDFLSFVYGENGPCTEFPNGCCPDTMWNLRTNTCTECQTGFFSANCSKICQYPYFGKKCQEKCLLCKPDMCNFKTGCNDSRHKDEHTHSINGKKEVHEIGSKKHSTDVMYVLIKTFMSVFGVLFLLYIIVVIVDRQKKNRNLGDLQNSEI
uniref:Uncharacterized protein LOC111102028 n=1 Tax=Crassostrea virginica TaxID=6565 RepID=A0A8B8AFX2_CRAVI|nr:uncharacterized protein LOC111102028 [Crassostrea virginica]